MHGWLSLQRNSTRRPCLAGFFKPGSGYYSSNPLIKIYLMLRAVNTLRARRPANTLPAIVPVKSWQMSGLTFFACDTLASKDWVWHAERKMHEMRQT